MDFHIRKEADVSKVELPVGFAREAMSKSANLRAVKISTRPAERLYLAIVYFGQPERFAQFSTSSYVFTEQRDSVIVFLHNHSTQKVCF